MDHSETISLRDAAEQLRLARDLDLAAALPAIFRLLLTEQLPPAIVWVDGVATKIEAPRWASVEMQGDQVRLKPARRAIRLTEVTIDRAAWQKYQDQPNPGLRGFRDFHHEDHAETREAQEKALRDHLDHGIPSCTPIPAGYVRLAEMVRALCDLVASARREQVRTRLRGNGQRQVSDDDNLLDRELAAARDWTQAQILMWLRTRRLSVQVFDLEDEAQTPGPAGAFWRTPEGKRALITGAVPLRDLPGKSGVGMVRPDEFAALAKEFLERENLLEQLQPSALVRIGLSVRRPPTRLLPFWPKAKEVGMTWLADNGFPEQGDGNQAKLEGHIAEWLEQRGKEASTPTIRRHVKKWIKQYRDEQGA